MELPCKVASICTAFARFSNDSTIPGAISLSKITATSSRHGGSLRRQMIPGNVVALFARTRNISGLRLIMARRLSRRGSHCRNDLLHRISIIASIDSNTNSGMSSLMPHLQLGEMQFPRWPEYVHRPDRLGT